MDLTGKRVAMIGAGASGFQIAPSIAGEVEQLTVFQRTAQWMFPNPNYHATVGPGGRWALRHLPFYGRWYRFLIFWPGCDKGLEAARVDPDYPDQQRAVSEMNELTRQMFTDWIVSQVGDDPDLIAKVVPDYPATGKRTLQDNGSWLQALTRDNVELVRTGIDRIEADGVVTVDGRHHPADVIVYATGFYANRVLWPLEITGRDGADLRALWGERPAAYLGITVPGFPNLFCMYGPGTNLAHGGSLIFHSECQMRYITQCLEELIVAGHQSMEPRRDKYEDWHERSQREIKKLVWSQPSVKPFVLQERVRRDPRPQSVAPRRLLELDEGTRPGRLRRTVSPATGVATVGSRDRLLAAAERCLPSVGHPPDDGDRDRPARPGCPGLALQALPRQGIAGGRHAGPHRRAVLGRCPCPDLSRRGHRCAGGGGGAHLAGSISLVRSCSGSRPRSPRPTPGRSGPDCGR